jgi:signal peptidase
LYAPGQYWLERKDIIGKAKGFVPYIGIVTILMNDYPQLKVIDSFKIFQKYFS